MSQHFQSVIRKVRHEEGDKWWLAVPGYMVDALNLRPRNPASRPSIYLLWAARRGERSLLLAPVTSKEARATYEVRVQLANQPGSGAVLAWSLLFIGGFDAKTIVGIDYPFPEHASASSLCYDLAAGKDMRAIRTDSAQEHVSESINGLLAAAFKGRLTASLKSFLRGLKLDYDAYLADLGAMLSRGLPRDCTVRDFAERAYSQLRERVTHDGKEFGSYLIAMENGDFADIRPLCADYTIEDRRDPTASLLVKGDTPHYKEVCKAFGIRNPAATSLDFLDVSNAEADGPFLAERGATGERDWLYAAVVLEPESCSLHVVFPRPEVRHRINHLRFRFPDEPGRLYESLVLIWRNEFDLRTAQANRVTASADPPVQSVMLDLTGSLEEDSKLFAQDPLLIQQRLQSGLRDSKHDLLVVDSVLGCERPTRSVTAVNLYSYSVEKTVWRHDQHVCEVCNSYEPVAAALTPRDPEACPGYVSGAEAAADPSVGHSSVPEHTLQCLATHDFLDVRFFVDTEDPGWAGRVWVHAAAGDSGALLFCFDKRLQAWHASEKGGQMGPAHACVFTVRADLVSFDSEHRERMLRAVRLIPGLTKDILKNLHDEAAFLRHAQEACVRLGAALAA